MANFQMFTFQLTGPAADTQQRYRRNACDRCATRKVKCDGKQPCSACHKTQAPCRYSYITRQPPKLKSPTTTAAPSPSTAPPLLNHTLQASVSTTLEPPTTSVDPRPDPIVSAAHSGPAGLMISTPVTYTAHSSQSQSASPIVPTAIAMPARPEDSPVLAQPSRSPLPRDMAQYLAALIQSLTLNPPYERNELISGERTGHGPATTAGLLHSSQTQPTPLPPLSSVIARSVSDPLPHGFIRPVLAPLVNHLAQTMSLPSPPTVLATEDDVIYHPTLIRCTLHAFVKHQIRIYRNLYFQRLMRKLNCNKIAPIVLHFLMAYGSSLFLQGQHGFTLEVCRYITQLHLDRFDYYLRMEHDQHHQEVPYIALAISGACTLSTNFNCYSKYSGK
ncbi:hypothetical protein H4R34_003228 [Dimargaris verticillata]|uniref:Zn(2)-C6 fungal-type domain-containing protein n=1 Tax=Dimargaris verticillata TaxID=2761393 RepID=A0A9W8EC75_9FUNG|nr:hypothetical protein H4R34_003228 [Dimargaris verticillata]